MKKRITINTTEEFNEMYEDIDILLVNGSDEDYIYKEDGYHAIFTKENEIIEYFIPARYIDVSVNYRNDNVTMEHVQINLLLNGKWVFDFDELDPQRTELQDLINDIIGWY